MKDEMRKELHHLLDKMIDDEKEVGTISRMIQNGNEYKVQNIRLTLHTQEHELK